MKNELEVEEKKPNQVLEFFKGIGTILLYFILVIVAQILLGSFLESKNKTTVTIAQLGIYIILLLGMILVYHKKVIHDLKSFKKEYIPVAFKNWIMGLGLMMISNIIIMTFVKDMATNESLNRELLSNYPISNIISMVFLAPLIEEITFRLSFKNAFKKWYTFSLVTAFFFGLAHIAKFELLEFLFIIPYGALGFFFAKALYQTDNIYTSFLMHMTHNAMCVLLILL